MSTTAIILRDDANLKITFSPEAERLKEDALTSSALIARVTNAAENETAVDAQTALKTVVSLVEKARKAAKAPVLDYGRKIDSAATEFVTELEAELVRVSELTGNFQTLEQAKVRAAEAARRLEEEKLERERVAEQERILEAQQAEQRRLSQEASLAALRLQEAKSAKDRAAAVADQLEIERQTKLAAATSHDALDAVNEHFSRRAADLPVVTATRAEGQIVKNDWLIEITDAWLLARCHPTCVKIEPRLTEIKELLKVGVNVKGIKATPVTNSNVRLGSERKAIEV